MIGWHWCFRLLLLSWVRQALANDSQFAEKLTFYPLENGLLLAHFQFTQSMAYVPGRMRRVTNYGSFPPVIGEIVEDFGVAEARISFGRGRWDHYVWGHPPSDSFELASTGIQLHAWIEGSDAEVDRQWEKLTGALSGIFCGSISLVNEAKTAQPQLALLPTCPSITNETHGLRFGVLPRETVCTENLTPWLKLLPCMSNVHLRPFQCFPLLLEH